MLEIKGKKFYLDGKPFNIYSGSIHYFRTLPEYWEDRLLKLKAAGFNTVETYVCWNLHEPKPNKFCFEGILDIENFIKMAQKIGLYCIVRPGPYICAEWDFGGLPAWLLKDKNMQIRCHYADYEKCVERFYRALFLRLVPLQITHGGNIIAMQVENEYGAYGNDKKYLVYLEKLMRDCGVDTLLFTSDGNWKNMLSGGTLPHIYTTLNFGSKAKSAFDVLKFVGKENEPLMCCEFWCGWFDHWGEPHHTRDEKSIVTEVQAFLDADANFNFYMFFGGTNFGFHAGANFMSDTPYCPTITSYDYSAPLTEWGDYTLTYHAVRKLLCEKQGIEMGELPPAPKFQSIGKIKLTETASLFKNLDNIGEKHCVPVPESMEYFGQNFGMIYYETILKGKYDMAPMSIHNVHDFGYVYFDGKRQTIIDRTKYTAPRKSSIKDWIFKKERKKDAILMPSLDGERKIGVLVDTMGRVNYGNNMIDRKGISDIYIGNQRHMGYDIWTLPLDNIDKLHYSNDGFDKNEPVFLKGSFHAENQNDCFVYLDGFKKGCVYINGFNLGRYWDIGPQKALYLPGVLLKEENEIVVLSMEGFKKAEIEILDKPNLG